MKLNKQAYDEFLRHIIIDSNENRFQTFLKAHARASDWFDDFHDTWESDQRVSVRSSARGEEDVAALRLLSLYTWEWSIGNTVPRGVYRDHTALTHLQVGRPFSFTGVGDRKVSSWSTKSIRMSADDVKQRNRGFSDKVRLHRYRLYWESPRASSILFVPGTLLVLDAAELYVRHLYDASSRAGKPSPLTHQRLSNLLYFLASLVTSVQAYSKEKEVIMYTPAPVKVEVLEERV